MMADVLKAGMDNGWLQWTGLMIPLILTLFKGWMADRQRAREHSELKADVKENTELTAQASTKADAAYKEANDVNAKIASMGEARAARHVAEAQQMTRIEESGAETRDSVGRLERGDTPPAKS
jgi:hypothetical protein